MIAETTIFVSTIGDEANFTDCMAHLRAQTAPRPVQVIERVAPMSAAFQMMLDQCSTRYYVQVDEDMLLFPHAISTLERLIAAAPPEVAMVCAPLWDCDTGRPIYGLKIYRHAIVRQFPYRDVQSCEIDQLARMGAKGFIYDLLPLSDRCSCLGEHGKHYSPESIFKRWERCFQTHRRHNNMEWIEPWATGLLDRYLETRETLHLYAFLGAVSGIVGAPFPNQEVNWRNANEALARIQRYFPISEEAVEDD
jgi:hypothetical protein